MSRGGAREVLAGACLAITAAAAVFAALASALTLLAGQSELTEAVLFGIAFAVLLPATLTGIFLLPGWKSLDGDALVELAAIGAAGLGGGLLAGRVAAAASGSAAAGEAVLLAALCACAGIAAWAAGRLGRRRSGSPRPRPAVLAAPAALLPILVLLFGAPSIPGVPLLFLSLVLGAALVALHGPLDSRPGGARQRLAVDLAAVALIVLLVADVTVYTAPFQTSADPQLHGGILASWLANHHDPFLGPVNDVLHGRTVLVDTYSQYGVGNIYALAAVFSVLPIGYGTFGVLAALGLALLYAAGYAILRLAGCSPFLASVALAAAIVSSVFQTIGSPAAFPAVGAQRWWPPIAVVLLAVIAARRPGWSRGAHLGSAVLVGVASIWSLEAFAYTAVTYAALAAYEAAGAEEGGRRAFWRAIVPALLAVLAFQLALTAFTVVRAGELPHWGTYAKYVREFSSGQADAVPAPAWWIGALVAGLYFSSLVGVGAAVRKRPEFARRNAPALIAVTGLAAFGAASFTYLVRFSWFDALIRLDLPALLLGALWVHLATRAGSSLPRATRMVVSVTAFWLAALLIVEGWGELDRKKERTPLVAAIPGAGGSLRDDLSTVWDNPLVDPRAPVAAGLLDRYWPGQSRALVLINPDLSVEALLRADRVNRLPVADFLAEDLAGSSTIPRVISALRELRPGTLMLTERFYLRPGARRDYVAPTALPLERLVINSIRRRFRLRPVARGAGGLLVVRLEAKRPRGRSTASAG